MTIEDCIHQFMSLNTNKHLGQIAPHKAIMLLSVIDLIETGKIKMNCFELSEELEKKFHENWNRYVGTSILFKPVPATPFYHLCNEPFWSLSRSDGSRIERMTSTPSIGYLRNNGIKAGIDEDMFSLMKSSDNRARMRTVLISTYLARPKTQIKKVLPFVVGFAVTRMFI